MAIDTILLLVGGVALAVGVVLLVGAPRLAGTVAGHATRPEHARRASGPDRMRLLIAAQQASTSRRLNLAVRLRIVGIALAVLGGVAFVTGVAMRSVLA